MMRSAATVVGYCCRCGHSHASLQKSDLPKVCGGGKHLLTLTEWLLAATVAAAAIVSDKEVSAMR